MTVQLLIYTGHQFIHPTPYVSCAKKVTNSMMNKCRILLLWNSPSIMLWY